MHGWENLHDSDRDAILRGIERGGVFGGPFHVEIDPMDPCNVACFFCNAAELRKDGQVLRWDVLGPVVDELLRGDLRSFRLAGGGEPLIYPDLAALCERMGQAGVPMDNLTTNGVRLTPSLDSLSLVKIRNILVSLNYARPEAYSRYMNRGPAAFEAVLDGIRALDKRLQSLGRRAETLIYTQFFIHRGAVADIGAMFDLALELPVDSLTLRIPDGLPEEERVLPEQISRVRELLRAHAPRARGKVWLELELKPLGLGPFALELLSDLRGVAGENLAPPRTIEYCYMPWYSMAFHGNGDVQTCCLLMTEDSIPPLGNIRKQSVSEIWNGPAYRRLRREMRTVMLFETQIPFQHRAFQCTLPRCWSHDGCFLTYLLADGEFHREAHSRLEALRRRPVTRATRFVTTHVRRLINRARPKE